MRVSRLESTLQMNIFFLYHEKLIGQEKMCQNILLLEGL